MKYVCDAPGARTWFRLETEDEAREEAAAMQHSMARQFRAEMEKARQSFRPPSSVFIEQEIGLKAHVLRAMPLFLTLREDADGTARVTAMLPQPSEGFGALRPVILGRANTDPYMRYGDAILALARHLGLTLERARCYPFPPGRH